MVWSFSVYIGSAMISVMCDPVCETTLGETCQGLFRDVIEGCLQRTNCAWTVPSPTHR